MFSRRITSPSFIAATAAFALGPTTSGSAANFTSWPRSSESLFATGARVFVFLSSSVFTLPRCEQRITFPPSAISFFIVGRAATSLFSSVISPFLRGTLKSQRQRTLLPFTFMSSTDFLLSPIWNSFLQKKRSPALKPDPCKIKVCNSQKLLVEELCEILDSSAHI